MQSFYGSGQNRSPELDANLQYERPLIHEKVAVGHGVIAKCYSRSQVDVMQCHVLLVSEKVEMTQKSTLFLLGCVCQEALPRDSLMAGLAGEALVSPVVHGAKLLRYTVLGK